MIFIALLFAIDTAVFNLGFLTTLVKPLPQNDIPIEKIEVDKGTLSNNGVLTADDDFPEVRLRLSEPSTVKSVTIPLKPAVTQYNQSMYKFLGAFVGKEYDVMISSIQGDEGDLEENANHGYVDLESRSLLTNVPATQTVLISTPLGYGIGVTTIRVTFTSLHQGEKVELERMFAFNEPVPYNFSFLRLIIISMVMAFIYAIRPSGRFANKNMRDVTQFDAGAIAVIIIILSLLLVGISSMSNIEDEPKPDDNLHVMGDNAQYQHMADALLEGNAYLSMEPPQWLTEIENPYDFRERVRIGGESGQYTLFDYAYKDGKYYSYFGVLPAAVFAVFKAIFGFHLSSQSAVAILSVIELLLLWRLLYLFCMRYTNKEKFTVARYLLFGVFITSASCLPLLAYHTAIYHIAILSGMVCATGGLILWIGSLTRKKRKWLSKTRFADKMPGRGIVLWKVAVGSLLFGMCIMCRPTIVLTAFLGIIIFKKQLAFIFDYPKEKLLAKGNKTQSALALQHDGISDDVNGRKADFKHNIIAVILAIVPFVLMLCIALFYNYIRFGSFLDFGASYNLTGFDMVHRAIDIRHIVFSMLLYFFAPLLPIAQFPFMFMYNQSMPWVGDIWTELGLVMEPFFGGVASLTPLFIVWAAILSPRIRGLLKKRKSLALVIGILAISIAICAIDSTVSVTQRYLSDFSWLLAFGAICIVSAILDNCSDKNKKTYEIFVAALIIIGVLLCALNLWSPFRHEPLIVNNPDLYWYVYSWFAGWFL